MAFGTDVTQKIFLWKIYDPDGTFITVWTDVLNDPSFSWEINGGFSELIVDLPRPVDGYGETEDVAHGNQVKLYVFDRDTGDAGVCIYSGYISRYESIVEGSREVVRVTFLGYYTELNQYMLESTYTGGATEIAYSSVGPEDILKDALDKFTAAGGKVDYDTGTVDDPATTVSYTFNTNLIQEVLQKVLELSPDGWYFRIDADDLIYYKEKSTTPDHTFIVGRNIISYRQEKRTENIVNRIFFRGDGTLYEIHQRTSSVSSYGQHSIKMVDERVSVSGTAQIICDRILDASESPEVRIVLEVLDNNGEGILGYDIESIKPGQTCRIIGDTSQGYSKWDEAIWDSAFWDYSITNSASTTLLIFRKEYSPSMARLEISNRQPDISKRIEDIRRNLLNTQTSDNPSTPS